MILLVAIGMRHITLTLLIIAALILPTLALNKILDDKFDEPDSRKHWILAVLLVPIFGATLYFIMRDAKKKIYEE